jgi:hypothetical protein
MPELSCIGYCAAYHRECELSAGVDKRGITSCRADDILTICPEEGDDGTA